MAGGEHAHDDRNDIGDFALVTDRATFDALGPEWSALFARSGQPHQVFQTFDWLWHWANHYLDRGTHLAIVTGRVRGRLALVWPLVSSRIFGAKVLSAMGEPASQYGDALVEEGPEAAALVARAFDFVKSLPVDIVWLRRVRDDAAIAPLLHREARQTGIAQAPFVDFSCARDAATFEKRYSAKLRSGRRRHLRRLQDIGPVAFEHYAPGAAARDFARLALAFKRDWATRSGRIAPTVSDPRLEGFFADAAAGCRHSLSLRTSVLSCAGEPIGVEISVACKGRLFGHMLAAKPGFEKQGAGAVLAAHSIASAIEQGYGAYDLLAPADPYKMEWASGCVGVRDFALPRTVAGSLFKSVWIDFGRELGRSIARHLPPRLGRLLLGGMQRIVRQAFAGRARDRSAPTGSKAAVARFL